MSGHNDNPPSGGNALAPVMNTLSLATSTPTSDTNATSNPPIVPAVTLVSDPPIDFSEAVTAAPAPGPAPHHPGVESGIDHAQAARIKALKNDLAYPVRNGEPWKRNETVMANHFRLEIDPETIFYEYQIVNIPDTEKRAGKKRYMTTTIQHVPFLANNRDSFATDNVKTLISWVDLHSMAPGPQVQIGNPLTEEGGEWRLIDITDRNLTSFLNLHYLRQVDIQGLQSFSTTSLTNPASFNPSLAENALNIIMAKCISETNTLHLNDHKFFVRKAYFDLATHNTAPLRAMRGYSYNVKPGMGYILLNVCPATSAFWRPLLVSQVLSTGLGPFGNDELALRGVRVYINYDRGSGDEANSGVNDQSARIKTIRGFGQACNVQTFELVVIDANGRRQSTWPTIEQYQQQRYNRTLVSPQLRAINVRTVIKPTWMAPEDLRILPDQIYAKVIPELVSRNFHDQSCHPPAETRSKIEQERGFNTFQSMRPSSWCPPIRLHANMLRIPAARLPYPTISYSHPPRPNIDERNGSWNLDNTKFLRGEQTPLRWKLLVERGVHDNVTQRFIAAFNRGIQDTGVCSNGEHQDSPIYLTNMHENSMQGVLKNMLQKKGSATPGLVVLLLRSRNVDAYSSFKYLTDKVFVLHSICASAATFLKQTNPRRVQQYMANISMKANLKRAGINHSALGLEQTLANTLVLGADVTHPGSGAMQGTPSIAAVVGSAEANGGRFSGRMRLQAPKQEMIADMKGMVYELLQSWCVTHNRYPANVLYYRDGVSTSQFDQVVSEELPEIRAAFQLLAHNRRPKDENGNLEDVVVPDFKLTAIIVSKRHSTRFFPSKLQDAMSANGNCKPGTLVDSIVTSPYYADFFLQSHNGIKGTARPCHYFILRNEMGLSIPRLQTLTHDLCHTYVRATLGVSYASPAYYADRLCERGRAYLRDWFSPSKEWRKWYNDKRVEIQGDIEAERERLNKGKAPRDRNKRKTDSERKAEKEDQQKLFDRMKQKLAPEINDRWTHSQDDESGAAVRYKTWRATMYWM